MGMPREDLPYCECNWLERAAQDPTCSVEFDPELNEYNLKTTSGGSMRIYHCPFCSGRAPDSLRGQLFAEVTPDETIRLHQLTKDFKTEDDVRKALGEPTNEFEPGIISQSAPKEGEAPVITASKSLIYEQHSKTATINVAVGRHGRVSINFSGQYIGRKKKDNKSEQATPRKPSD